MSKAGRSAFGGLSAQEFHNKHAYPPEARCQCGNRPAMVARVLCPLDEAMKRNMLPNAAMQVPSQLAQMLANSTVQINEGGTSKTYVKVSEVYACEVHKRLLKRTAAKGAPSWCIVEFNEGPNPTNRVSVGVS